MTRETRQSIAIWAGFVAVPQSFLYALTILSSGWDLDAPAWWVAALIYAYQVPYLACAVWIAFNWRALAR